jgi:hypothetical protein
MRKASENLLAEVNESAIASQAKQQSASYSKAREHTLFLFLT